MKRALLGLFLLTAMTTQSALATKGDVLCTFPTDRGQASLFLDMTEKGLRADLNLMGNRILPYEYVLKGPNPLFPRYTSQTIELTLDLQNKLQGAMGNTRVSGLLTLRLQDLGVTNQRITCEVRNQ